MNWLRSWGLTVLVVFLVVAAGTGVWAGYFSQWFALQSIVVTGNATVSQAQVVRQLAVPVGEPLMRVDLSEAKTHVESIRVVASAQVSREFPHTLRVEVVERVAVAWVDRPEGAHLVDKTGMDFATVPHVDVSLTAPDAGQAGAATPPARLPELSVARPRPQDAVTKAALVVLNQLPDELRSQVVRLDAKSENEVSVTLADDRVVVFGSSEDVPRKAQAAISALKAPIPPGQVYDVSAAPVVTFH